MGSYVIRVMAVAAVGLCATVGATPYRHRERAGQDTLTFWGWSSDGAFAYETYTSAEREDADCSDEAALRVIDATRDRQVANGMLRVVNGLRGPAGGCRILDVRAELAARRTAFLARHHIVDTSSRPAGFESSAASWISPRPGGGEIAARFAENLGPDKTSAGYRLVLRLRPNRELAVVTPRIPGALGFDMEEAMIFYDPKQRRAAVFVSQINRVHHGVWASWDSHGLAIGE